MKRTLKQKSQWYRRWKSSGLTQYEFCKKHGLPSSSIRNWRAQTQSQSQQTHTFVPIEITEPKKRSCHYTVRIGVIELEIPYDFDEKEVARLIHSLGVINQ